MATAAAPVPTVCGASIGAEIDPDHVVAVTAISYKQRDIKNGPVWSNGRVAG